MSRPAFSLCLCPDSQLLRNRIDALLAACPLPQESGLSVSSAWQRLVFWADEGLSASFWEHLTLQGLFAVPKALVLRNAQLLPAEKLKQLNTVLEPMAAGRAFSLIWPLICFETPFDKGHAKIPAHITRLPFWQIAEQHAWIDETPGLSEHNLPAYIRREASRHGLSLSSQETGALAQALPPDAARITTELAKLALGADAKGRLPADALSLGEHSRELGIFELMRIIQGQGNAPAGWKHILDDATSGDSTVFAFIAILLREARILWQSLAGSPPALPPQIAMQKKALAHKLGFAGIARLWELALVAEKGIKSGERSPDQAFAALSADLFALFGRAAPTVPGARQRR